MLTLVYLHKEKLLGVLRRGAVGFLDFAALSAFPRKSHADSCDEVNFSVEILRHLTVTFS